MKNIRFTIGNKILGGFITLIIVFIIYAGVNIYTVSKNSELIEENSTVIKPSLTAIKDFNTLIIRSKMLITNWVYLQSNDSDKEALKQIHEVEYDTLKNELSGLMKQWEDSVNRKKMDTIFGDFEELLAVQQDIMGSLQTFEDYEDAIVKLMAAESIDREVLPRTDSLLVDLEEVLQEKQAESDSYEDQVLESSNSLQTTTIILSIVFVVLGLIGAFLLANNITKPINYLKDLIVKLGNGILPEDDKEKSFGNDEIGEMAVAVNQLVDGLKDTSYFAENIGNGKYDTEYEPLSEEDVLGNALINMRSNLKSVAEEDKKRNWATEGLAMFGDILRKNNDNMEKLSDEIISNLVKYTKSNQGGIFIINDENDDEPYLELTACYAWDKKKYIEQKIYEGEGLTGQVWLEGESIYMTEVPQDYVMITSGLGEANPNSILIVPLKVNDEIYGVIEMASFNEFEDYERDFVEKIAESIASTISSVKINARTNKLLEESREMTEQMRSQEEEMRQNMEELQATQEEMERSQRDREDKEKIINYTNMMIELDERFAITSINSIFTEKLGYQYSDVSGQNLGKIITEDEVYENFKSSIKSDKTWSGILKAKDSSGEIKFIHVSGGSIHDQSGNKNYLILAIEINREKLI